MVFQGHAILISYFDLVLAIAILPCVCHVWGEQGKHCCVSSMKSL